MSDEKKPNLPSTTEDPSSTDLDVIPEDPAGNALNSVTNFISGLDPNTWLARNASKAFGKLCSAPKGWFDAYFEGKAAEARAESEGRVKIIEAGTDQIIQQMQVPSEYAKRAGEKFAEKIIGEQINLDKISGIAANELQTTESTNSTNQDANSSEEKVIDDVWLNIFEREARPQSTEEGQLLFGRILAGEIRNPGSYSFRTLKILGELDQNVAVLFKRLCSLSTGLMKSSGISTLRVLNLESNPLSSHTLEKHGLSANALSTLEEYGLVLDSDFTHWHFEKFPILLRHQGQYWSVSPTNNTDENQQLDLYGIQFSRVGCELYGLVDQETLPEYTADLKGFLAGLNLSVIEVNIISIDKDKGILIAKPKHG